MTHMAYVVAAYLVSAFGIAGLAAWILIDQAAQQRALKDLESRGVRRRSAASEASR